MGRIKLCQKTQGLTILNEEVKGNNYVIFHNGQHQDYCWLTTHWYETLLAKIYWTFTDTYGLQSNCWWETKALIFIFGQFSGTIKQQGLAFNWIYKLCQLYRNSNSHVRSKHSFAASSIFTNRGRHNTQNFYITSELNLRYGVSNRQFVQQLVKVSIIGQIQRFTLLSICEGNPNMIGGFP